MNPFNSKGCFCFGKFKGKTFREVLFKEPKYIRWCNENIDGFKKAVDTLHNPQPKAKRKTSQQVAEEAAFKKLTLNDRLRQITARARKDGNSLIEQAEREIQKNEAEDEFPEFDENYEPPY